MNNNFKHCHDFLSSKVKFMHTNTVTESHSCLEKTMRTPRVHLFYVIESMFNLESFLDASLTQSSPIVAILIRPSFIMAH